ncbi:MAG: 50S ribosomal protein L4 [Candidatus Latescibacteria bacterium]|jgi:large subunit ribosomal protein L4|nr:50S ribosomal protein L4 [Candidatus Latescibacterota bacterium]
MPTARLYQSDGTEQGQIELEPSVFGIEPNDHAIYEAEKLYLANQRQGTVRTQTRSDVSYTSKKMFRQKGLGRARMGSARSPSRVGGGRAFGPKPRDYSYTIPKKVKRLAVKSVLSNHAQADSVLVIDDINFDIPKTREMVALLEALSVDSRKCLVLMDRSDETVYKSCRNIPRVSVDLASSAHIHELLHSDVLIFTREGLKQVEEALKS